MTPNERERMAILCERIAKEQNLAKFKQYVRELNELLGRKEQRLENAGSGVPAAQRPRDRISARSKRPGSRTS
jgi:hypothetical protein